MNDIENNSTNKQAYVENLKYVILNNLIHIYNKYISVHIIMRLHGALRNFLPIKNRHAWLAFETWSSASPHNRSNGFILDLDKIAEQADEVMIERFLVALFTA